LVRDLDINDEGSEQTFEPLQSIHHISVAYQPMRTQIDITKKAKSLQAQLRTQARIRKMQQNVV
jgi:hypothetical protein